MPVKPVNRKQSQSLPTSRLVVTNLANFLEARFLASDMREARGQEYGTGETTAIDYYRDRISIYTKLSVGWSM